MKIGNHGIDHPIAIARSNQNLGRKNQRLDSLFVHPIEYYADGLTTRQGHIFILIGFPLIGNRVQGKSEAAAKQLLDDALAIQEAGAFSVVLECVPAKLASLITEKLSIPTIGIGAGAGCDGQILVYQDMLGMFTDYVPKFVRHFGKVGEAMVGAFKAYDQAVKAGDFPNEDDEAFKLASEDDLNRLY